uniref:Uncharacterized protein n=1 Tax=Arundo donax TaxID=35708 RepID=A0A0A9DC01_ARUDO
MLQKFSGGRRWWSCDDAPAQSIQSVACRYRRGVSSTIAREVFGTLVECTSTVILL